MEVEFPWRASSSEGKEVGWESECEGWTAVFEVEIDLEVRGLIDGRSR